MGAVRILIVIFILLMIALILESLHIWLTSTYGFYPIKEYIEMSNTGTDVNLPSGSHGIHYMVDPSAKTILYLHGNAGNISYWRHMINLITTMKINMFIVDYRGFGKAKAYSTVRGFVADAFEAYEYLSKTVKSENIILWGESMGGYAALKVAQLKPVGYLALAATFTKSTDMVEYLGLPLYYKFIAKREPLNNIKMISNIRVPTVILHSIEDDVIPYRCGEELYDKCHSKSKLFITLQGTHSNPKITTENLQWLLDFCQINSEVSNVEPILEKIYKDTQKACPLKLPETFQ